MLKLKIKIYLILVLTSFVWATLTESNANNEFIEEKLIDPLNVIKDNAHKLLQHKQEHQRNERGIFGYFQKSNKPAAQTSYGSRSGYGFSRQSPYGYSRDSESAPRSAPRSAPSYTGGLPRSYDGPDLKRGGYGSSNAFSRPHQFQRENFEQFLNTGSNFWDKGNAKDFLMQSRQKYLPQYSDCPNYPLPSNVLYSCRNEICEISCPAMYNFPDGRNTLRVACSRGSWIIRDSEYINIPPCQASCKPPCQNNGICLEAGICKCPDNYSGPLCQYKKSGCAGKPPIPKNSKVTCTNNVCNAECMRGFQYPDGSSVTNIRCLDSQWINTKTNSTKPPDCSPICEPSCENNGQCISFNVCQCDKMYRGDHCQYNINNCNITQTEFNGNYKCSYDNEFAKCLLSCPLQSDLIVEGDLTIEYKCLYSEGVFQPSPLPRCIYPPGYMIKPGSKYSHHTTHNAKLIHNEPLTMHEKMLRIISKYKDIEQKTEWWSSEETIVFPQSFSLYEDNRMEIVPKLSQCATWNGFNVKTFDGFVYKTPLECSYILVTDMQDATFEIILKACTSNSDYTCSHSLKLYWQSILYTFENQNGTIQLFTPSKNLPIPVQLMGIKVVSVAEQLQIYLDSVGLKISWDRNKYISVEANPILWGRLGGLCGTLDGNYTNDMITKSGSKVETLKSFTDAWHFDDTNDKQCLMETSDELQYTSKTCNVDNRQKAVNICEHLLLTDKFQECLKNYNFEALFQSCIQDYCTCPQHEHPEKCNCDTVAVLAKECQFNGVLLEQGWRNLEICPISCTFGRVYLPCGPDIEPTCETSVVPTKSKCNEGCFCPEGTVQYKEVCINSELCPCRMKGKEFKPDSTIKKHCNTCTCKNGQWHCTDEKCSARCGAIGDPHYQTFDGKRYDFMGKCSYYLLKMANMSVEAENVACSGAISENLNLARTSLSEDPSCTKSVSINFIQKNGIATNIKLDQGFYISVNNREVTKLPKIFNNNEVLIRRASSTFITIEFATGLRIWWDGVSRVYIDAPPSYRDQTAGLCGTFNSNTQDDFLTPEGDIESAVEPFADKWRTKDSCDILTDTPILPHPCSIHVDNKAKAEKYCAWLMEDVFQECHWSVEPEEYYENCMYDVCACKEEDISKCFCPILSSYGAECARQGIQTGWRLAIKECAIKCPMGQIYDECGDSCANSCEDLPTKSTCQRDCVEGCRCPNGEYLNEADECVPQSKCHCTYDGINFKAGYKEVRPGTKFLDICTCLNGLWECEDAEPGDEEKYPPSSELRAECAKRPYAEFSKCSPPEPRTCKNMHDYHPGNMDDCEPGCICSPDYVFDTARKTCVLPENCSCHHGGKSYNDGETIQQDCNTCTCQSGHWQCSDNVCESTCSVWGDSHFTTFDQHDFDFQGACDYILSKGIDDNGDGFTITIQNVLCGTLGVTCSKSLEISLIGSTQDTLTLTADSTYFIDPDKSILTKIRDAIHSKKHDAFHVYRAGLFIVIEVVALHLHVKWDEGTRVYVKLGTEWKGKVNGLCGNYNDNAKDDMQTPSQSLEVSPLIFGHAWKVQTYCSVPVQPIDACKEHPERETWAQLKCGILKTSLFKDCHGEVPVERYLKRCIFDTCACDQGGDCECLCTAVAAYSYACSQKGINVRWRSHHFCPMQCDPHCSEYKACTPACPIETCDNFLDQSTADYICKKEHCFEGCLIKPCDEGMIYLNDTYQQCIPKSECKPICMIKEGITYYEGDILYQDDCSTCRCSKHKEVCSGIKCNEKIITDKPPALLENETTISIGTQPQAKCIKGWTRWFDNDNENTGKDIQLNDIEKLPRYNRFENIYGTCLKKYMKKIECRVVKTHKSHEFMDEQVKCDLNEGLVCVGQCHDYEIRVFCQCDEETMTTPSPFNKEIDNKQGCDSIMAEYKEYPNCCHRFLHCQQKSTGEWSYVEKTCGDHMMFNPILNVCDHISVVQKLKPICLNQTLEEDEKECPEGQVPSKCTNQCEHTCHYYGMILKKRGLCKDNELCQPGCMDIKKADCFEQKKYWRDENTCVELDECPCMDLETETYVQPHMPFINENEICQCIDNAYTCMANKIITEAPIFNTSKSTHSAEFVFPITVTPPINCAEELLVPLMQNDESLSYTTFSASSELGAQYNAANGRLLLESKQTGAWSPMVNDQMQYLQITFNEATPLFGIIMAGHTDFNNYVTLFKILYSRDGIAYHNLVDDSDTPELFNGPLQARQMKKSLFKIPIEAKSVRIYPLKWHNSIAMRVEVLGCDLIETTLSPSTIRATESSPISSFTESLTTDYDFMTETDFTDYTETKIPLVITTEKSETDKPKLLPKIIEEEDFCMDPMGIQNNQMKSQQIKASSSALLMGKKTKVIDTLKLDSLHGWRPIVNTPNEYLEFDFLEPRNITGFISKGGPDGWVTSYKVVFSKNKLIWNKIRAKNDEDSEEKIFPANHDSDTEKINKFDTVILTQYIKLMPVQWEQNINMRVEPLGCFKPYPEMKESLIELEKPKEIQCLICDGVVETSPSKMEAEHCKCPQNLFWNGTACIQSNLCPCFENFIAYPIGSKFENKDCEECVCVLGGHTNCKPKKCPPCGKNLRPILGSNCYCKCEPCPKQQKLCPSSGDCIPEVLWCNGVQDCADDEDSTCQHKFDVIPEQIKQRNETEVIECPVPECPPQMKLKLTQKKRRQMSQMFESTLTQKYIMKREGNRVIKTKIITSSEEFNTSGQGHGENVSGTLAEEECNEFTCIPIPKKILNQNETITCTEPKCPSNYDIELDLSNTKPGNCPKYSCVLRPSKDDVCEISGKTFTTFDGTEYKYETCSHILARDLINNTWTVSIHLQCDNGGLRQVCRKTITINDIENEAVLIILPNMRVNFNGFEYTVQQLINSPICKASFIISQPGNTVLVVSPKRGFWVSYDDIGYIKIGISSKFIKTVDGLCGFYNGIPHDDKRSPDGIVLSNTVKFGDSWFDKKISKDVCYPQSCPLELQKKALALCNTIRHPTFMKCSKAVNSKQYISKCMETTCECLRANNNDVNHCKCNILQDFVKKCLQVNPHIQLDTWRAVHQCEIKCPPTLVHADCFKRRCEPSCDTLQTDDCPIISDACFSGCYCPEGTIHKGERCVPITECKDCICNTIGSSKYFTFDRNGFTFNGNCTYLLSRDIVLPGVHTFQIYVVMDDCSKFTESNNDLSSNFTSCAKSLYVLYGDHVIHIQRTPGGSKILKTFVDSFEVKTLPYKDMWINLREIVGKELILSLPEPHLDLKVSFENFIFSIGVPSITYGSKLEGLCGNCDKDPNNDLQLNEKKKDRSIQNETNPELVDILNSWKADEPKLGLDNNECSSEDIVTEDCIPLPPEEDPCLSFFDENIFGKCSMIVDPVMYISACQQDMCKLGNNPNGSCESLTAYAKECAKNGICVNWRTPNLCPYSCPNDMIYKPCSCSQTCDTLKELSEYQAINMDTNAVVNTINKDDLCSQDDRFEGCFCPPGKVMEKGKCIREEMCIKCEDRERMPGERWKKNPCTECLCDKMGKTQCVEQKCTVEENICAEGFRPQKIDSENECCPHYACIPEPKLPHPKVCLEPIMPVCGPGQIHKTKTGSDGCPQYICECKPREDCDNLEALENLKPGEKTVIVESGCCPTQKVICDNTTCPEKPEVCSKAYYEIMEHKNPTDCCPSYECKPPRNLCIVNSSSYEKQGIVTKKLLEKWLNPQNPCEEQICTYGPNDTTQIVTTPIECDINKCSKGYDYVKLDDNKCCGECIQISCIHDDVLYKPGDKWSSQDKCTTYTCDRKNNTLIVNAAITTCPNVSNCTGELIMDETGCCQYCKKKPVSEPLRNCLAVSLAESDTLQLIQLYKPGHGYCTNKAAVQGFTECVGSCNSGSKYNKATFSQDKICHCCNIKTYKNLTIPLTCEDGLKVEKIVEIPDTCGCHPCSDSIEYNIGPRIDVRSQPLPLAELLQQP